MFPSRWSDVKLALVPPPTPTPPVTEMMSTTLSFSQLQGVNTCVLLSFTSSLTRCLPVLYFLFLPPNQLPMSRNTGYP